LRRKLVKKYPEVQPFPERWPDPALKFVEVRARCWKSETKADPDVSTVCRKPTRLVFEI
jgi:hypothetical protein